MIEKIVEIIRNLNSGCVIPGQQDANTKIELGKESTELYIDFSGLEGKYYFFSELCMDAEFNDNLSEIEKILISNDAYAAVGEPKPSDSYLLLFWKVKAINDALYPYIIKIEENEFFFKKYVFYYTDSELECFTQWYENMKQQGIHTLSEILKEISDLNEDSEELSFLTRLLIKIPFFELKFPKAVMNDYDELVQKKISSTRQKKEMETINELFLSMVEDENVDSESISKLIYTKLMED